MTEALRLSGSTSNADAPPDMDAFALDDLDWRGAPGWVALTLLLGLTFLRVVHWLTLSWSSELSYYEHGALVPFVCAGLLWSDRGRLSRLPRRADPRGVLVLGLSLSLLCLGLLGYSVFLQGAGLVGSIFAIGLTVHGWARMRATWFVWFYALAFMVPIDSGLVSELTVDMRLWAAGWTYGAVEALGLPAVLIGDSIHFPDVVVQVEDVCSGLRSVVSLLALAFLFAWLEPVRWKGALMLALAIPIALVANAARILVLCLLAANGSPHASEGWIHEGTGVLIYGVAALLLYAVHALPGRAPQDARPSEPVARPPSPPPTPAWLLRALVAVALVGFTVSTAQRVSRRMRSESGQTRVTNATSKIPRTFGAWIGQDVGDPARYARHYTDYVLRQYRRPGSPHVELFVVHAADASGIHGPRGCYMLQGFVETARETSELRVASGALVTTRVVIAQGRTRHLIHYWHRIDGEHLGGRYAQAKHNAAFLGRVFFADDQRHGATIRISTPIDTLEAAEARLAAFADEALDAVLAPLP